VTTRRLAILVLAAPESDVDLARSKIAIDRLIDPSIDAERTLAQLDAMASQVRSMVPASASKHDVVVALQTYLYVAGPWNGGQPFRYDLDDPYGKIVKNKLLATYLATRRGNCVSMPLLFIVLGQKLGLDVTAAEAPEHVFVKFRDEQGRLFNIEATSGGFKADAGYEKDLPMSPQALASGIRMDLAQLSPEYVTELAAHHVGGRLKVAPEHTSDAVLGLMKKPSIANFDVFAEQYKEASKAAGKPKQFLVPYFIAGHPGSGLPEMIDLGAWRRPFAVQ